MRCGFNSRPTLTGPLRAWRAGVLLLLAAAALSPTAADPVTPAQGPGLTTDLRTGGGQPALTGVRPELYAGVPGRSELAGDGRHPGAATPLAVDPWADAWGEDFGGGAFLPSAAVSWLMQGGAVLLLYWLARRWRRPARW